MKLHKKVFGMLLVLCLILGSSATAFASSPVNDVKAALERTGLPADQTGKLVEYLQKINISEGQAALVKTNLNAASEKFKEAAVDKKVSYESVKNDVHNELQAAASAIGLKADFSQLDSKGNRVVTIIDKDGKQIGSVDVVTAIKKVSGTDSAAIVSAVSSAAAFSNNPLKSTFEPVTGGTMNHTATNYGNLMILGFIMVITAIGSLLFGKKIARN